MKSVKSNNFEENLMSNKKEDNSSDRIIEENQDNNDSQPSTLPKNPRELVENPAVTPEMLETAPEDLRGDLFREPGSSDTSDRLGEG